MGVDFGGVYHWGEGGGGVETLNPGSYITGALASEPQVAGVTRTGERPFGIPGFSPAGVTQRCGALRHSRV